MVIIQLRLIEFNIHLYFEITFNNILWYYIAIIRKSDIFIKLPSTILKHALLRTCCSSLYPIFHHLFMFIIYEHIVQRYLSTWLVKTQLLSITLKNQYLYCKLCIVYYTHICTAFNIIFRITAGK